MSIPLEIRKKWEGQIVDQKFPLRQWLGGSEHSAVFLTQRGNGTGQKAAIKLISAENVNEDAQLSRWAAAANISHPHVIRIFERGRCVVNGSRLLYVVMELADEDLSQILPLRPLTLGEASEMLLPVADALNSLHTSGFAHGSVKPANILAAGNQLKLSADSAGRAGELLERAATGYDAPEVGSKGLSPAGDMWSLGATLVAVLTQKEPALKRGIPEPMAVPKTIPPPFGEIARECLLDESQRCSAGDILRRLQPPTEIASPRGFDSSAPQKQRPTPMRWVGVVIVVLAIAVAAWFYSKGRSRQSEAPASNSLAVVPVGETPAQNPPANPASPPPAAALSNSTSRQPSPANPNSARGSVRQRVMPEASRGALRTIHGRIKITVQVVVDNSGNVSDAHLVSPGPSKYFSSKALDAARQWKFNPPQINGQPVATAWLLRFQFARTSVQAFSEQAK